MVQDGVVAAQYVRSWQRQPEDAVLIAPAYTFLMSNRPVEHQFWLDVGATGWWERLYQPLTHPYVLSRRWEPGQPVDRPGRVRCPAGGDGGARPGPGAPLPEAGAPGPERAGRERQRPARRRCCGRSRACCVRQAACRTAAAGDADATRRYLMPFTPRPKQAEVLAYAGGMMGVSAVPGSGKTHVLSALAAQLVADGGLADDQEVLIVTLVNSAVDNFARASTSSSGARGCCRTSATGCGRCTGWRTTSCASGRGCWGWPTTSASRTSGVRRRSCRRRWLPGSRRTRIRCSPFLDPALDDRSARMGAARAVARRS